MQTILSQILIIPFVLWATFTPLLHHNASMTKESISIQLYEISKEAAVKGRFDEELYIRFKEQLFEKHGYRPECIQISGDEELVRKGEPINVTVTIPKPIMSIFDAVKMSSCDRPESYTPYNMPLSINSEYIP